MKQNLNVPQIFHKIGFPNKEYVSKQMEKDERTEANFMTYHLRAMGVFNGDRNAAYTLSDKQVCEYKVFLNGIILKEARKLDPTFVL